MTGNSENLIAAVIDDAEEMQDPVVVTPQSHKPRLLIENCDPDRTVSALRDSSPLYLVEGEADGHAPVI